MKSPYETHEDAYEEYKEVTLEELEELPNEIKKMDAEMDAAMDAEIWEEAERNAIKNYGETPKKEPMSNKKLRQQKFAKEAAIKEYKETLTAHRNTHLVIDWTIEDLKKCIRLENQELSDAYLKKLYHLKLKKLPGVTKRKLRAIDNLRKNHGFESKQIEY